MVPLEQISCCSNSAAYNDASGVGGRPETQITAGMIFVAAPHHEIGIVMAWYGLGNV
jgi:hypothetical protein